MSVLMNMNKTTFGFRYIQPIKKMHTQGNLASRRRGERHITVLKYKNSLDFDQ